MGLGLERPQPSAEQARRVVAYLRGGDDFARGAIDWLAVGRLGANLAGSDACGRPGTAPALPLRAQSALATRRAIVSGERPIVRDAPASFETLGALYFILTAGQYAQECANQLSPQGRHRWRFSEPAAGGARTQTCDLCGDQRTV